MKMQYWLFLLFCICSILIQSQEDPEKEQQKPAQCYCSDLCGPRDVKSDDTPEFNEQYGVCFCKPRDKENYIPNGCHLKNNQDFKNSCQRKQTFNPAE